MHLLRVFPLLVLLITECHTQSELDDDVFELREAKPERIIEDMPDDLFMDRETNEGSDAFEVSTAMVEPLEVTTSPSPPATNTTSSELTEELQPDPFDSDEKPSTPSDPQTETTDKGMETTTEKTNSMNSNSTTTSEESETTTSEVESSSPSVTDVLLEGLVGTSLEHRVLKEKELETTSLPMTSSTSDTMTSSPSDSMTSSPFDTMTSSTSDTMTSSPSDSMTSSPSETMTSTEEVEGTEEEQEEKETESPLIASVTPSFAISKQTMEVSSTPSTTSDETSTSSTSSPDEPVDDSETDPPFDQENLSNLFEPDGSPTQSVAEGEDPQFPLVQLPPEESAEIISEMGSRGKSSEVVTSTVEDITTPIEDITTSEDIQDTTEAETSTVDELEPETSTVEETTVNEESTTEQQQQQQQQEEEEEVEEEQTTQKPSEEESTVNNEEEEQVEEEAAEEEKEKAKPHQVVKARPVETHRTPMTLKITSIDWMDDFADKSSGKYRKLKDQMTPEITSILQKVLGDDFIEFELTDLTKGSVVINGQIVSKHAIQNSEDLASQIEAIISQHNSQLAGNTVDSKSVTVNGTPSRAFLDKVQSSYEPAAPSAFLIGSVIAIAILVVLAVGLLVIFIYNRRSNGTIKLKEDEISRAEMGMKPKSYDNVVVNLKAYGSNNGGTTETTTNSMNSVPIHF